MFSHTGADRGFTLVECLVVIAVFSLLLTLGIPPMQSLLARQQALADRNEFHAALHLARNHAIHYSVDTVICAAGKTSGCAAGGGQWARGWLVFEDPDGDGLCAPEPGTGKCTLGGGRVVRVASRDPERNVVSNHNVSRRVRFGGMGMSYGYTGRFTFCPRKHPDAAAGLVVPQTGRIRTARDGELLECPEPD
jgi:type IV fimbrial biogenesis protein FimT